MPDFQVTDPATPLPGEQGQHYELIKQAIPTCLVNSSPSRRKALKDTPPAIPRWYDAASQAHKDQLKVLLDARCDSLNELEKTFSHIRSEQAFAQPLLEAKLKAIGHELDVNQTWLRLYVPVEDAFGVKTSGFRVKTFSLLHAALGNFEQRETQEGYFDSASGFITQPDVRDHFERHTTTLKIHAFTQLCRDLDLGKQYQAHLKAQLKPDDAESQAELRERYVRHQKAAFKAAAYLALLKGDIGDSDHALLMRVAAGEKHILSDGKPIGYRSLSLMNLHLHDCLVIDACAKPGYTCWVIVYIPDDPDHPIKRYETFSDFSTALSERLSAKTTQEADRSQGWKATPNQHFFARFVADKDRAYYYKRLTELVLDAPPQRFGAQALRSEWGRLLTSPSFATPSTLGEPHPYVRVHATAPEFNIRAHTLTDLWQVADLWTYRLGSLRTRLFENARHRAVSTADVDEASRSLRAAHYMSIGLFGLNLVAMAVPPLGVVMAVAMAGQMLYEVIEGVIELSEGDREAGWAHITDVVENLATLAAQAAVVHFTVSPFIEQLKAVTLPSGKTRLWNPDLSVYEHSSSLPAVAVDEQGLHRHNGQTVLPLEGKRYAVQQDPLTEQYRILHPTRAEAYQPILKSNGAGLWNHEVERPHTWEGATLMRRLGPVTEGFSDAELEQVRSVAAVSEDVLRRVHVEGEPVPAILLDTLRQFRAYRDAVSVAEGIRQGSLRSALCSYAASLAVELPGWPASKAIEAFSGTELSGPSIKYGNQQAAAADTVQVHRADLMSGQLPIRIIEAFSEPQRDALVGSYTARTPVARTEALQLKLEQRAIEVRERLMKSIYLEQQPPSDSAIMLIQRDFSSVPTILAREVLADATPTERDTMNRAKRIPLRLAEKARRAQQQMRLTLAYEGLYLDALAGPDTETLALNTLPMLPGWSDNLRLEVREGRFEGPLRASFGPQEASNRKVLARMEDGRYQAFDERGQDLHGLDGFYGALQHALTDAHRNAIGLPHVGQGEQLKGLIQQHALGRAPLRKALGMSPEKLPFFRPPSVLPGERRGYPLSGRGGTEWEKITRERVRSLYPEITRDEMLALINERGALDLSWLRALEQEYKTLQSTLHNWLRTPPQGMEAFGDQQRQVLRARRKIYTALDDAWRKVGPSHYDRNGRLLGQKIEWLEEDLAQQLRTLPALTANFDHVSYLGIVGTEGSELADADVQPLLANFRGLRRLGIEAAQLTRLPSAIEQMPHLQRLHLGGNSIVLKPEDVLRLKDRVHLKELFLEMNPLGLPPDVGRMTRLQTLLLNHTSLEEWPASVFRVPRPENFILDMRENPIARIPEFAPGSDKALIVAKTFLTREELTPELLAQFKRYIEAAGRDPDRQLPKRGARDSEQWKTGYSAQEWPSRQVLWDMLEGSFGSEGFFNVLRAVRNSGDSTVGGGVWLPELTAKVWRILEAMGEDAELREQLFLMARDPAACVDAGAQMFNAMGVAVLHWSAYFSEDVASVRKTVFNLARGKWRLDELGRIAHERVSQLQADGVKFPEYNAQGARIDHYDARGNLIDDIDEVEIYLAYTTPLANRLDLPWQSRSMMFHEEYVTAPMVEAAFNRVQLLDQGELLRGNLLEQPMWTDFLQRAHPADYASIAAKFDALIDYQAAQEQWAAAANRPESARQALRQTISRSAQRLGRPASESEPGQLMSQQDYDDTFGRINAELITLNQTLTDQAISAVL
ncbi:dermonecrotic toxin domain-containing protein [Pseudomonas carnis]|uniref:dermonecrotic toxin domain-containing protein n=1 Tax=Pseudomonas carnis TaxID=2487355 RepID=UPI001BC96961|nr:DUF6543 domain-containing protein [Pseudomonas carnis]